MKIDDFNTFYFYFLNYDCVIYGSLLKKATSGP